MAEDSGGKDCVLAAVAKLSASLNEMVQDGRENYKQTGSINDFVKSHGKDSPHGLLTLYPVQLYAECFKSLGVKSRRELEDLWSGWYLRDEDMQRAAKELLSAEEAYEGFVEELNQIMATHEEETALPVITRGEHLLTDATFTDAGTGDSISLSNLLKKAPYTLFVLRKHYV